MQHPPSGACNSREAARWGRQRPTRPTVNQDGTVDHCNGGPKPTGRNIAGDDLECRRRRASAKRGQWRTRDSKNRDIPTIAGYEEYCKAFVKNSINNDNACGISCLMEVFVLSALISCINCRHLTETFIGWFCRSFCFQGVEYFKALCGLVSGYN